MILSKADWSKKYNCTRAAVTMAVKQGRLDCSLDGTLDERNKINQLWISKLKKKPQIEKEKKKVKNEVVKENQKQKVKTIILDNDDDDLDEQGLIYIKKTDAEVRYKREQIRAIKQKRLERLGVLIEKELVRRVFDSFAADLKLRLLGLPKVLSPRIISLVKSGEKENTIQGMLEDEISNAIKTAKQILIKADFGNEE